MHTDYYIAELARFANPRMARIADLTTRFRLHHESTGYPNSPPFDALFAPSYFVGRHPAVVAEGRPTYVTHGAVDTVEFDPDRVQPAPICDKRTWSSPAGPTTGPVFGFIARLSMEKGPGMFLAAAQIVLAALPSARFVMVGRPNTPTYLEAIKQLARVYGIDKHVRMVLCL